MENEIKISRPKMNHFDEMVEAYAKVMNNDAQGLKGIYQKNPDALFNRITARRDTIFHIAAYRGNEQVIQVLVKLVATSKKLEVLKMKNIHGNTILHEVATTTNIKAADVIIRELLFSDGRQLNQESDIREREEILGDRNKLGETPLFRAAEYGNKMMVMYLAREIERVGSLFSHYKRDDGVSILHIAVMGQHLDTAIWFLEKTPELASYKDKNGKTSFHLLASMATAFKSCSHPTGKFKKFIYFCLPSHSCNEDEADQLPLNVENKDLEHGCPNQSDRSKGFKLYCATLGCLAKGWKMIGRMWNQKKMHASAVKLAQILVQTDASWFEPHEPEEEDTICLERKCEEETVTKTAGEIEESPEPDTPLFIAASNGIVEIVNEILSRYPQAIEHISKTGQNILHVAILHRKYSVFESVKSKEETTRLVWGIDNHGCTILHHAADTKYYQGGSNLHTPTLQLQRELTRFEEVKDKVPSHFTLHRNKKNKTADQLFKEMHREQLKTAQDWVKNTSQSCSTVAVLVATVVFAAAYTSPGGFDQKDGTPILLGKKKALFSFFTVMDVAGLASSLTSVVIFLSILTSSLEFEDFHHRLPRNLSLGFTFLFFSVTTTMLTFTATVLLLVHLEKKWTTTLTYIATFLPICVFTLFIFPLYYQYFVAAVKSIFDFLRRNLPGNWEFLKIKDN